MLKQLHIQDDLSATRGKVVRLKCECGYEDKAFTRDAIRRAENHMRVAHTHGRITYMDSTLEV